MLMIFYKLFVILKVEIQIREYTHVTKGKKFMCQKPRTRRDIEEFQVLDDIPSRKQYQIKNVHAEIRVFGSLN